MCILIISRDLNYINSLERNLYNTLPSLSIIICFIFIIALGAGLLLSYIDYF